MVSCPNTLISSSHMSGHPEHMKTIWESGWIAFFFSHVPALPGLSIRTYGKDLLSPVGDALSTTILFFFWSIARSKSAKACLIFSHILWFSGWSIIRLLVTIFTTDHYHSVQQCPYILDWHGQISFHGPNQTDNSTNEVAMRAWTNILERRARTRTDTTTWARRYLSRGPLVLPPPPH